MPQLELLQYFLCLWVPLVNNRLIIFVLIWHDYPFYDSQLLVGPLLASVYAYPYVNLVWVVIFIGLFLQMKKRVCGTRGYIVKHLFFSIE